LTQNKALDSGGCTLFSRNSLEKDSLKKSLKSQSSLGSCCSLAPQQVSQMFKWARDLSWTRWRSINTPHEVQRSANRFTLKTGSSDAVSVAPDALHRAFGAPPRLTVPASDRSSDANSQRPVAPSGALESFTTSLSMGPDTTRCVRCSGEVYNLPGCGTGRYPVRPVRASGA